MACLFLHALTSALLQIGALFLLSCVASRKITDINFYLLAFTKGKEVLRLCDVM